MVPLEANIPPCNQPISLSVLQFSNLDSVSFEGVSVKHTLYGVSAFCTFLRDENGISTNFLKSRVLVQQHIICGRHGSFGFGTVSPYSIREPRHWLAREEVRILEREDAQRTRLSVCSNMALRARQATKSMFTR